MLLKIYNFIRSKSISKKIGRKFVEMFGIILGLFWEFCDFGIVEIFIKIFGLFWDFFGISEIF